jgi:hypothetical protein
MRSRRLTSGLTILALAVATSACAPSATHAQAAQAPIETAPAEPALPAPPAPPAAPAEAAAPTTRSKEDRARANELRQRAEEVRARTEQARELQQNIAKMQSDLGRSYADVGKREGALKFAWAGGRVPSPDSPVIISTQPIDSTAATEWKEDLQVMDKVIREEVARGGADDPQAMGIKLTMLGRSGPMYVEGAGAIFSASVNFPLAPIGATTGKKDEKPRDPASKWEKAKRELSGYPMPARRVDGGEVEEGPALVFDQAKVDQLKSAMAKALVEASNIRHLAGNESVFVTIVGIDEGAMPVRWTLKAAKADIDAAAAGKLSPEEFAKRIAQRVG